MSFSSYWIPFYTIVKKEVVRFMRIWTQTLLPPVITQSLYFLIFGGVIGSQIRMITLQTETGEKSIPYMAFIVPGLVMMGIITNSFSNVVSSFFGSKFQRNIEELLVSPTPSWVIVAGYIFGGVLRGLMVGFIVFCVSFFFVKPEIYNVFWVLLFSFLTSTVFALGGLINGIFAKRFDDVSIFPTFVLTPLTYLGGVFYSIKSLPPVWQNVSKANPIVYMIDGFRYGFYGVAEVNLTLSLSILVGLTIFLAALGVWLLEKGYGMRS